MADSHDPSKREGRRVALLVAAIFGTIALIFGSIAGYVLTTGTGPHDVIAIMGGGAWVAASVIVALGLAALSEPIRGGSRSGPYREAGAGIDPEAFEARAWAAEGVEWSGEADVPFDAPAPTLFMALSGLGLGGFGVVLYGLGRVTPVGVAIDLALGGFLLYWAWLAWSDRAKRAAETADRQDATRG